jgi:hypothetical protein
MTRPDGKRPAHPIRPVPTCERETHMTGPNTRERASHRSANGEGPMADQMTTPDVRERADRRLMDRKAHMADQMPNTRHTRSDRFRPVDGKRT